MEENIELRKIEKPEWKWYYFIPFTRGRSDYKKDRELYEFQFLSPIQKIRKQEEMAINSVSVLIITLITALWTLLPPLTDLPHWLNWMAMGMEGFGTQNWGNQIMLSLVPTASGTLIHKFPYMVPNKGLKTALNIVIKIVPVLLLIACFYLIHKEKQVLNYKRLEKVKNTLK